MTSHPLFELLRTLEKQRHHFELARHRNDTVMVTVTLVGLRLEIDVFEDGHLEYSLFSGSESVHSDLDRLKAILEERDEL
jgi:hypothetical protein